jgi:ribonucleoside-triphosphate reductase
MKRRCHLSTEVYSRVVGYFRPVQHWNAGKQEEYRHRKTYVITHEANEEQPRARV